MIKNIKIKNELRILIKISIFVLIVFLFYIIYHNTNKTSSIYNGPIYSFKSSDIPYIPKNMQLKDKDNKVARHLKFRFVYTCPDKIYDKIKDTVNNNINNNIHKLFYFMRNNDIYICFFLINDIDVHLPTYLSNKIKCYPYKMYDTYVMGETRIFTDIKDILMCQGVDRDMYGTNCISTTYLNEICSNKMEYIRYFMKHNLMIGTYIKSYKQNSDLNVYTGMYVKAPYSSRSACAAYEQVGSECFLEDGVIVQEKNNMLNKYEIKCYVLDGKVIMIIVRLDGINYNVCVPDDYKGVSDDIRLIVETYRNDIYEICEKGYNSINALTNMRITKLKFDEKYVSNLFDDLKKSNINLSNDEKMEIKYILTGLVNSEKIKLINEINDKYNKNYDYNPIIKKINDYDDPIENKTDYKIYDRFMRIDMAVPDNNIYNKMTITEIEPFASGIYMYKTIGPCLKNNNLNKFDNITKYNLYNIISSEK